MESINLKPEPGLKVLWNVVNLLILVLALLIPAFLAIVNEEILLMLIIGGIIIFIFLLVAIYIPAFYNTLEYRIDSEGVKLKKGVFWRRRTTVPYSKITNIDITQGPLERMLGFSRLHIQTAGSNSSETGKAELIINGIRDCETLKNTIMRQIAVPGSVLPVSKNEASSDSQILKDILTELSEIKQILVSK
jgi:membrane protein YdbS with pleckstrin-like domain